MDIPKILLQKADEITEKLKIKYPELAPFFKGCFLNTIETTVTKDVKITTSDNKSKPFEKVAPKQIGVLDMVIAFDTTGSMAAYIDAVRQEVSDLIPRLFKDNENLRLGVVAFGDYCDMLNAQEFGDAYQCLMPTNSENEIIKFVRESKDTHGGDGDEFYELVIKKIVEETPWREGSTRAILLISDADPHPVGYTYENYVVNNQIDWRKEAQRAAEMKIKIDMRGKRSGGKKNEEETTLLKSKIIKNHNFQKSISFSNC